MKSSLKAGSQYWSSESFLPTSFEQPGCTVSWVGTPPVILTQVSEEGGKGTCKLIPPRSPWKPPSHLFVKQGQQEFMELSLAEVFRREEVSERGRAVDGG